MLVQVVLLIGPFANKSSQVYFDPSPVPISVLVSSILIIFSSKCNPSEVSASPECAQPPGKMDSLHLGINSGSAVIKFHHAARETSEVVSIFARLHAKSNGGILEP